MALEEKSLKIRSIWKLWHNFLGIQGKSFMYLKHRNLFSVIFFLGIWENYNFSSHFFFPVFFRNFFFPWLSHLNSRRNRVKLKFGRTGVYTVYTIWVRGLWVLSPPPRKNSCLRLCWWAIFLLILILKFIMHSKFAWHFLALFYDKYICCNFKYLRFLLIL